MKLSFSAQLLKVETKSDRTLKLTLGTQEMGREAGELVNLNGQQVNVLFVGPDEQITAQDVPDVPTGEEYGARTPSQLQRALLYKIWEAKGKAGTFEVFYRARMGHNERLLKEELDQLTI